MEEQQRKRNVRQHGRSVRNCPNGGVSREGLHPRLHHPARVCPRGETTRLPIMRAHVACCAVHTRTWSWWGSHACAWVSCKCDCARPHTLPFAMPPLLPSRYTPACEKLIAQFKTCMNLLKGEVTSLEQFMKDYKVINPGIPL